MGTEPETRGSSSVPARRFRKVQGPKRLGLGTLPGWQGQRTGGRWPWPLTAFRPQISKPLMEKKRRARINVSLEQLRSLLEKHYSHQVSPRGVVVVGDTVPASSPPTLAPQLRTFSTTHRSGNASWRRQTYWN